MTSIETLNAQLKAIQEERTQIFEQIRPLQEKAASLHKEIESINEAITKETLKIELSEQDRFDFLMAENGGGADQLRYTEARKFIDSFGLYMSGYNPDSQQRMADVFIFKFDADRNVQSIASLKKLIELFKPMDEEGNKSFRVFCQDSTIFAHTDGTFSLRSRYARKDFKTLEELFAHYVDYCDCYDAEEQPDNDD